MKRPASEPGELATDRWLTPPDVVEILDALWPNGIDLDPFSDPSMHCKIEAARRFDVRKGEDAYVIPWRNGPSDSVFVNGPYSGDHPARTMRTIVGFVLEQPSTEVVNLCPAAPGSVYWGRWCWPYANAIGWLGRLSFVAGVDIVSDGRVVARAGELVRGNRTEIALVYHGARREAFRRILCSAGYQSVSL